jgi:Fe2+ transport system protein FeoA
MGLCPGVEVQVITNGGAGPFVVAVHGTRIVLGRGMAHKVYVTR